MTLVALWFAQRKNFKGSKKTRAAIISELRFLSSNVQKVLDECTAFSKKVAAEIKQYKHLYLMGEGLGEIVGKEGALKIKELTYNHCQCLNINNVSNHFYNYSSKNPGTPVIFIVLEGLNKNMMMEGMKLLAQKVNITTIVITDVVDKTSREWLEAFSSGRLFTVPRSGYLSALLCVLPLQRLAYDTTVALGYDPDRPRNLAKELTTK